MKNKYLTRCLCITLVAGMVLTGSSAALASDTANEISLEAEKIETDLTAQSEFEDMQGEDEFVSEPEETPAPEPEEPPAPWPEETPTPEPEEPTAPEVTPTPGPEDPAEPDMTPTPGPEDPTVPEVSPVPTPDPEEVVKFLIEKINEIALEEVSLELKEKIEVIRKAYETLSEENQALVTNFKIFEEIERVYQNLLFDSELPPEQELPFGDGSEPIISDGTDHFNTNVQIGQPVYFTNMVSNLHAGKEFYLNSLKKNYQLEFSSDFPAVMEQIEKEYKSRNKLADASDASANGLTSSADQLLVRNWQDILAIYIYENPKKEGGTYVMDASCKKALAKIFEEMNPVVRDKKHITRVSYGNRHINYYIKKNKIPKSRRRILKKYVETDCKLLCATVTGAKGFVRQSVGDNVSEERVNVITAAYSLIGKVGYFWGGKSNVIGEDNRWGRTARVSSPGSNSTGTVRAYGLDCSGFVTWAAVNGYKNKGMEVVVGSGTSDQWMKANVISEASAQPGDLVFQHGPEAGSDNHVGILCGKTDAGDWIAVHCSAGQNGVTVGEAYGASFRYIRQPSFYPSAEEQKFMTENNSPSLTVGDHMISTITVNDSIKDILSSAQNMVSGNPFDDFTGPMLPPTASILQDTIVLNGDDIEVFTAE